MQMCSILKEKGIIICVNDEHQLKASFPIGKSVGFE